MAGTPNTTVKLKKVWAAPELKKTSIELITANGNNAAANDGHPNKS